MTRSDNEIPRARTDIVLLHFMFHQKRDSINNNLYERRMPGAKSHIYVG